MKVLIIIPFFGETPTWINYFIRSCEINKKFNWLLYGNLQISISLPSNVYNVKANLQELATLASSKLGYSVAFQNPYKVCDFRPAFGKIFEDYIHGFDFWGYSDLDLVYGNISKFISDSDLTRFDVITTKKEYIAGHFTLISNKENLKSLYKKIFRIEFILKDFSKHYCIDERSNLTGNLLNYKSQNEPGPKNFLSGIMRSFLYRMYQKKLLAFDFSQVIDKEEKKGTIRILRKTEVVSDLFFNKNKLGDWKILWKNGDLEDIVRNKRIMYFHLISSKSSDKFKISQQNKVGNFYISPEGINLID